MSKVSLLIRARNEADGLKRTLIGVHEQTRSPEEVIVLDNESDDPTVEVAEKYGAKVEVIGRQSFSYGSALNRALSVTTGDIIIFLSAHSPPVNSLWLVRLIAPIEANQAKVTFGRQVPEPNVDHLEEWITLRTFPCKPSWLKRLIGFQRITFSNANSAMRRDLLQAHRFREDLAFAEDIEWARRISHNGHRPIYCPDAAVYHSHRLSHNELEQRMEAVGRSKAQVGIGEIYRNPFICSLVRIATMTIDLIYCLNQGYWATIPTIPAYRSAFFNGLRRGLFMPP